jgi:hypothetical protein
MQQTLTQAGGLQQGTCPLLDVTGKTPDTSEHLDFGFCNLLNLGQQPSEGGLEECLIELADSCRTGC